MIIKKYPLLVLMVTILFFTTSCSSSDPTSTNNTNSKIETLTTDQEKTTNDMAINQMVTPQEEISKENLITIKNVLMDEYELLVLDITNDSDKDIMVNEASLNFNLLDGTTEYPYTGKLVVDIVIPSGEAGSLETMLDTDPSQIKSIDLLDNEGIHLTNYSFETTLDDYLIQNGSGYYNEEPIPESAVIENNHITVFDNGLALNSFEQDENLENIVGIIENTTSEYIDSITISIAFYDENNNKISSNTDYISILEPYATWKFKVPADMNSYTYTFDYIEAY